jgi:integrase
MARGWIRDIGPNTRRPRGGWQAVYVDPSGRQRSRMFDRNEKRLAERWLREMQAQIDRDEWRDPAAGKVLFRDWAERWLAQQTFRSTTRTTVTYRLHRHLLPGFGRTPVRLIDRPQIQAWSRGMARDGYADSYIASLATLLGWIMAAAEDAGLIARSPCRRVKLATGRPKRRPMVLDDEQAATFLAAMRREWQAQVLVMLATGMRWGEAAGLARGRVDLLRREVAVLHQRQRDTLGPVKTAASERLLPLPDAAVQTLAALLPAGCGPDWLVFRSIRGGPVSRTSFRTCGWPQAAEKAGLAGLVPHDLRRTYASWLEDGGIPRSTIMLLLGHKLDTDTTGLYIRPLPEVRGRVIRVLDERLPGPVLPEAKSA